MLGSAAAVADEWGQYRECIDRINRCTDGSAYYCQVTLDRCANLISDHDRRTVECGAFYARCNLEDTTGCQQLLLCPGHRRRHAEQILEAKKVIEERAAQFAREKAEEQRARGGNEPQLAAPPAPASRPQEPNSYELFAALLESLRKDASNGLTSVDTAHLVPFAAALAFLGLMALGAPVARRLRLHERIHRFVNLDAATPGSSSPVVPPPVRSLLAQPSLEIAAPSNERDPHRTAAAEEALKLAAAYLDDEDHASGALTDPTAASRLLQVATLAAKQLTIAERNDPAAAYTTTVDDVEIRRTIDQLKAQALHFEGMARYADNPRKALRIIRRAIALDPSFPLYHYIYGLLAREHDWHGAINALKTAVDLQPDNIEFKKLLFETQNISGGERMIAGTFKAARNTARLARWLVVLTVVGIIVGIVATYGLGNVALGILCIIGLAIGGKIDQWARR
jgi:tetratricopeptide (TPR) repeat protein